MISFLRFKMNIIQILTLLVCTVLYSCDPHKRLLIKASPKGKTAVEVYTNTPIHASFLSETGKKMVIRVPSVDQPSVYKKEFFYGVNNWHTSALQELAVQIDSIVFIRQDGKITLKRDDIFPYLKKNISGYALSKLTIEAQ